MNATATALTLSLTLTLTAGDAAAAPAEKAPITRFTKVDAHLYRGGQPDAAGFAYLRDLGVRTIVSLRSEDDERATVEALGMRYVHIPVALKPFGLSGKIPQEALDRFMQVVDDPESGPVFVHCKRGADRTGTFVGLYRMARQGWTLTHAFDEARDIGMRWWHFGVKGQLRALAPRFAAPVLVS